MFDVITILIYIADIVASALLCMAKLIFSLFLVVVLYAESFARDMLEPIIDLKYKPNKGSECIFIPQLNDYSINSPVNLFNSIRREMEKKIHKVKYIYPFGRRFLIKEILPASGVVVLADRLKNIIIHVPENSHIDFLSEKIKTPKEINPLMKNTLWGYLTSQYTGAKAAFVYNFK